jgi:hypothetical protein
MMDVLLLFAFLVLHRVLLKGQNGLDENAQHYAVHVAIAGGLLELIPSIFAAFGSSTI